MQRVTDYIKGTFTGYKAVHRAEYAALWSVVILEVAVAIITWLW